MADGYERADGSRVPQGEGGAAHADSLLTELRQAVASPLIHVTAMPFSAPTIPSLLASGLAADLAAQQAAGLAMVQQVLGMDPSTAVVRPPGGALDDAAVSALAALGASTILGDADTVERPPQPNEFAPPPTAALAVGGQTVDLVLPDAGTQALLSQAGFLADPVRAAQATLGELATIWQEAPVPSSPRGVSVLLPAGASRAVLGRVPRTAGIRPVPATRRRRRSGRADPSARGAQRDRLASDGSLLARVRREHQARPARSAGAPIHARGAHAPARPARSRPALRGVRRVPRQRDRGAGVDRSREPGHPRRLLASRPRHEPGVHVPVRHRVDPAADGRPRRAPDPILPAATVEPVPVPRG